MNLVVGKWYLRLEDSGSGWWQKGDIVKVMSSEGESVRVYITPLIRGRLNGWIVCKEWSDYEFSEITEEEAMIHKMSRET
jgi:hypothetical protein